MNKSKDQPKSNQSLNQYDELKTEGPLSEKDEVKAAEHNTAKLLKKPARNKEEEK